MQIILLEKVVNLGNLGEVVKVKDGYARNFLIPQGKAKRATANNVEAFAAKRAELEKIAAQRLAAAQDVAAKLDGTEVQIVSKARVDGRLFGSVSTADIATALVEKGFTVAKADVRLPDGALKTIGDYEVEISLHTDVSVKVKVSIVSEA
ncbi:50S ribosomal protein L9 [Uliginosibacterium sp. H3]|uniref:Large ribosomal subunit protein bL9 n=1 Tax=Uliginosibacterium silvisoli TaxID=3114758 RepID=A0ABU6K9T2_9RHOO|nr:50S ribosomal protein L9 [Uliginosibacterium sp. H3]